MSEPRCPHCTSTNVEQLELPTDAQGRHFVRAVICHDCGSSELRGRSSL